MSPLRRRAEKPMHHAQYTLVVTILPPCCFTEALDCFAALLSIIMTFFSSGFRAVHDTRIAVANEMLDMRWRARRVQPTTATAPARTAKGFVLAGDWSLG